MSTATPAALFAPADWLALLEVSLTGVNLLRPLYGPAGELADFALEYLNPAAQRMTGLAEQPGGTMRTRFPATFTNGVFAFYRGVFETGEAGRYRVNYQADGFDNYFHVAARRSGERLVVSFTDTSDHARGPVETALRASQAREQQARAEAEHQRGELQRVLTQAPTAIAIFRGPQYVIELANDQHLALWGRTREQVLGRPLFEALPEVRGLGYEALLHGVLTTGVPYVAHERSARLLRHGQAEDVCFSFVYQPLREADGRISGVVVVASEITELVRARQQVEQLNQELEARVRRRTQEAQAAHAEAEAQRAHLQRVFEQAPVAIAIFRGPQYVIELANPRVCAIWGRTPAQALGTPLFELLPEAAGQGFEQLLDGVLATGVPYVAHELPSLIDRHGRRDTVYWNFVYQPLREATGAITGVTVVAAEVTDQVLARQQAQKRNESLQLSNTGLHQRNQRLLHTNQDLDNFVYMASHDLRNPISTIEGLLLALRQDLALPPGQGQVPKLLDLMQKSVDRFTRTLQSLGEIARFQQDATSLATTVDLAQLIAEVQLDLASQLAATAGQLTVDVSACATLHFAEKNLRSIVYNLLSNALKYRHPDRAPQLTIRCYSTHNAQVLTVRDNGLGLTVTQQRQLFGLFQRQHSHVEGSGIGLYMVKKIMENAGGTVEVESELGVGSTFLVYFPS